MLKASQSTEFFNSKTMTKLHLSLIIALCAIAIGGCGNKTATPHEAQSIFQEDFTTISDIPEKQYLERIYNNNQRLNEQLSTLTVSLAEFNDSSEFMNTKKLTILKEEAIKNKEFLEDYWANFFEILNEWENIIDNTDEEERMDFFERYLALQYIRWVNEDYLNAYINYIDFIISNQKKYFIDGNDIVFNSKSGWETCYNNAYTLSALQKEYNDEVEKEQSNWSENLKLPLLGDYSELADKCSTVTGYSGEERYKLSISVELDSKVKTTMRKAELERERHEIMKQI